MADRPPPYETHISVDSEVRGLSSKLEIVDNELLILDLERHQARLRQIELKALQRRIKKNRDILRLQNRPNTNYWTSRDHPWDREVKVLLQDKFNLEAFRPKQIEAINALLSGKNVITICPPGYGKSLIYQLPACMVQDKITIVIEPTVSKIADQILKLRQFNIKSTTLNSFSRATEPKKIHERINLNKSRISFLFVTAQWVARSALFRRHIRKYFLRGDLARIVIDEFQYCSRSCPEYKISYGNLNALKNISPRIPILALSSGAKNEALEDFQKLLNLQEAVIISEVTNNTNIYLKVVSKPIKLKQSVRFLKHMLLNDLEGKFGIIYVTSTTLAFKVKRLLDIDHLNIVVYTQSLNFKERNKIHNKWFNGEIQIIITATEALFDIEKPDVDFVLHFCAPKSMDVFYYEVSKAGRNRQKAEAILFYNIYDIFNNVCKIGEDKNITKALDILNYAQNLLVCRRYFFMNHFDQNFSNDRCPKMCDICEKKQTPKFYDIRPALYIACETSKLMHSKMTITKLIQMWEEEFHMRITLKEALEVIGYLIERNFISIFKGTSAMNKFVYLKPLCHYIEVHEPILAAFHSDLKGFQRVQYDFKDPFANNQAARGINLPSCSHTA